MKSADSEGKTGSEPRIAETAPAVVELDAGTYSWCTCGRSQNQPFCDGSHAGTGLSPLRVEIEETTRVALCQCKHTDKPPWCDGSHAGLEPTAERPSS